MDTFIFFVVCYIVKNPTCVLVIGCPRNVYRHPGYNVCRDNYPEKPGFPFGTTSGILWEKSAINIGKTKMGL